MTTYVYHANLDLPYEPGYDFGLFHKKADAKQACQDEQADTPIEWDNSNRNHSFAQSALFSDGFFTVTRRPVR